MASLFTLQKIGTINVGASLFIDLGLIPTGYKEWIGSVIYSSPYKVCTFNLRTNNAGKSAGTKLTTDTTILDTWTSSSKVKSITKDLYKNGTLHVSTVAGTGVEHWWLEITSKSSTVASCSYTINYTDE
jgi:hypothetical protein